MKFFFADNLDYVDPCFDFIADKNNTDRIPHIDDVYPHEYFSSPPYDGMLVSYNAVGSLLSKNRYTHNQKIKFWREGARNFLRYPYENYKGDPKNYPIMGDCGAFSYIKSEKVPVTNEEIIDFYQTCGFTYGVSVDHIIIDKNEHWDNETKRPENITYRAEITSENAKKFINLCSELKVDFYPIGVVQFWSPKSAVNYARKLVEYGYDYIGLGGLVGHPVSYVRNVLAELRDALPVEIRIHIFGFTSVNKLDIFTGLRLTSFDSTSPIIKAFKDDEFNYFAQNGNRYIAIRIPCIYENKNIRKMIQTGVINQDNALKLEQQSLKSFRDYNNGNLSLETAVKNIIEYEQYVLGNTNNEKKYLKTLTDKPWLECQCKVCQDIGHEVVVYRGLNRNKRRGFHNLWVLNNYKKGVMEKMKHIQVPCIKTKQSEKSTIYSFVINGKDISQFASVSRVRRDENGDFLGYQRPEVLDHIADIREYLDKEYAILPNSIVIAFKDKLEFVNESQTDDNISMGLLNIPISEDKKIGWIVDGQQRSAALRTLKKEYFPVSVIGFESDNVEREREQFVLINNTKPLPRSLIHELLPRIDNVPPKFKKRKTAYCLLEKLNHEKSSPFYHRIKSTTTAHLESANIQDTSVLIMIENSMTNGILNRYKNNEKKAYELLTIFWCAVKDYYHDAWDLTPQKSRLTHGAGIKSMGYIMDAICYKIIKQGSIPESNIFTRELDILGKDIGWKSGNWNFGENHILPWSEIKNISSHINLMTNFLIRKYRFGSKT